MQKTIKKNKSICDTCVIADSCMTRVQFPPEDFCEEKQYLFALTEADHEFIAMIFKNYRWKLERQTHAKPNDAHLQSDNKTLDKLQPRLTDVQSKIFEDRPRRSCPVVI